MTIREESDAFGKTRLMQLWTGTVGSTTMDTRPTNRVYPRILESKILGGKSGLPYEQMVSIRAATGDQRSLTPSILTHGEA